MKHFSKSITLMFIILFLTYNTISAAQLNSDTSVCLEIKGKILNLSKKNSSTYKIELIYFNTVVNKEVIDINKPFKFKLKKDAIYTIRISKDGYITKLISIYTKMPEGNNDVYDLDFETELLEEHKSKTLNTDALDFPITIIYFEEKVKLFHFNEEYTNNIKKSIYDVKVVRKKL